MTFYQQETDIHNLDAMEDMCRQLLEQDISTTAELEAWIADVSTFQEKVEEILTGHYIEFQCRSNDESAKKAVEFDQQYVEPLRKTYTAAWDKKLLQHPLTSSLPESYAFLMKKKINAQELYDEENVQLEIKEDELANTYFEYTGGLTVSWDGREMSLSELAPFFESKDRNIRKQAFLLQKEAFMGIAEELQAIMSRLLTLRKEKAANAGVSDYRYYMFKQYERFDYTPEDCRTLAYAIRDHVRPWKEKLQEQHQYKLGVDTYRPWDVRATTDEEASLKPFQTRGELVSRASSVLAEIHPPFADLLETMDKQEMLDLTGRQGKAPGGFCSFLPVSKLSFIFMNASGVHDDMITLLHEMGHCIHNDYMKSLEIPEYKDVPMEAAELASMSMELLTMDYWHYYYPDNKELRQAKLHHLKDIIHFLPFGIVVDQFQHWMYENPEHTEQERAEKFQELEQFFDAGGVDWSEVEEWQQLSWLRILHIFEVPLYFIDYVIAQLGALQVYKRYRQEPEAAVEDLTAALALGSSVPLPEIYERAGIAFDFSSDKTEELMTFLQEEINQLEQ
ncbi:M3 family oligoendopeptidase [Alkalicoccus chagannorensis]|uniref:M3 family oligoendopeptidase n=1 Tax=Alkalicoccus chagannorensis TaxID=427072 RepID=UPI0004092E0E|nr:M3 family oligoendopeptidase [Alkalicoccus chagannorensis]